jgi:hypothetical protein
VLSDVGYVVPTLGVRLDGLKASLSALRAAGVGHVAIVAPQSKHDEIRSAVDINGVTLVPDPQLGLAAAITSGIRVFSPDITFVNWIADDDEVLPSGVSRLREALLASLDSPLAYGRCLYTSQNGHVVFTTKARFFYPQLMRFGPQLVSQPAVLFRRSAYDAAGGLRVDLSCAFDLDLFIRMSQLAPFVSCSVDVARFGWHPGSLSVASRRMATREASRVRRQYLPPVLRHLSFAYEPLVRSSIWLAGKRITAKSRLTSKVD